MKNIAKRGFGGILRPAVVPLWVLGGVGAAACSAGEGGPRETSVQTDAPIVFQAEKLVEYENATNNEQEWATAVGLLTNTANLNRTSNGVPKNCPDKTQSTFECTAVLQTINSILCSGEDFQEQKDVSPACTAFMIKNEPNQPAIFATASHCLIDANDCAGSSVVLKWRRSQPNFPGGNPNILEQHLYQCTSILARGGPAGSLGSPQDWLVFQVDRHVTGGGVTGGPLTTEREALPLSAVGAVPSADATTIGHPLGMPTKIDQDAKLGASVPGRAGMFFVFTDAMDGHSGAPVLDESGQVVGIMSEARGPVKVDSCFRQCFDPSGNPICPPLTGVDGPNGFAATAVNIAQLPSQFRTSAEHVMILLDQTGSMTQVTTGTRTRWDEAIDAALAWVQFDKLSAGLVDRAYSIWAFRDDTSIGGSQTGAVRVWPQSGSTDCANFDAASGYCVFPRATSLEPAEYVALQERLETMREANRAVAGPNTPLARSLCQSLEHLKTLGGLKRIIVESDGGENSTPLSDLCFGEPSADFGDWSVDLSLRTLVDWGMTLDSWQAKVVRGATRFGLPLADAVLNPLGGDDFFPFDLVWQVDVHYALAEPSSTFARTAAVREPLEWIDGGTGTATARAAAVLGDTAPLALSATPSIAGAELSFFRNVGHATPRSSFKEYVHEGGEVFGTDHVVAGDVNDDGCVNTADLCVMQQSDVWLHRAVPPNTPDVKSDLDRDGWVNSSDLDVFTAHWGGGCTNPPALPNIDTAIAACHADYARRWLSFEDPQRPWQRATGSVTLSTTTSAATHMQQSLQVNGCQFSTIASPVFATSELPAGNKLAVDVSLPTQQQNPNWLGDLQLFISIPSAGINNQWIGQRLFQGLSLGAFHTLDFTLPANVKTALASNRTDATLSFGLNTGNCLAPVLLDNVRIRN